VSVGRPRRWTRESLLLVANQRAQGRSWREIGHDLGTSGSRVYELFTGRPPEARDPATWTILRGDRALEDLFQKCGRDLEGSRARAPAAGPGRPAGSRSARTSENPRVMLNGRPGPRARRVFGKRSKSSPRGVSCPKCDAAPGHPCKRPSGHSVFGGGFHVERGR